MKRRKWPYITFFLTTLAACIAADARDGKIKKILKTYKKNIVYLAVLGYKNYFVLYFNSIYSDWIYKNYIQLLSCKFSF